MDRRPLVVAAGLGPADANLLPDVTRRVVAGSTRAFVRTTRHPAFEPEALGRPRAGTIESFDVLYDGAERVEDAYRAMADRLVEVAYAVADDASSSGGGQLSTSTSVVPDGVVGAPPAAAYVAYLVPGSPLLAERTVGLLRRDPRVILAVAPAPSFLDLVWSRLGIDPVELGVRLVDAADFATAAAGCAGPLLVAQCHDRGVLSAVKLAVDDPSEPAAAEEPHAVLLHHLGLDDEVVVEVPWSEIDRSVEPDHLTSLWVPRLASPVASELVRLAELVRVLRARCPWDRRQTHASLAPHLLEETYETLDALDVLDTVAVAASIPEERAAVDHLEEELGDLLFQIYFHANLAAEEGRFTLADVARTVHDKLVRRHPHVFGDATAHSAQEVADRWEVSKLSEKGRRSVTDGIPAALPALALATKLQRRAESLGREAPDLEQLRRTVDSATRRLTARPVTPAVTEAEAEQTAGAALFALVDVARRRGVDPEAALRARAAAFRRQVQASE